MPRFSNRGRRLIQRPFVAPVRANQPPTPAAGGTVGDTVSHNQTFTITGSGFGTRTIVHEIHDFCTNASVSTLWNDAVGFSYSTGVNGVAMPHANTNKYAAAQITNDNVGNAWLSHNFTGITGTKIVYIDAYRRHDPNWSFGPLCDDPVGPPADSDNNFKYLTVSAGGSYFVEPYFYHDQGNGQKCSLTADIDDEFNSAGSLGTLDNNLTTYGGVSDQTNDYWYNWVKVQYTLVLHASAGQIVYGINNNGKIAQGSLNTDDAAGDARAISLGAYARQRDGANHYIYLADVNMVLGPGAAARVLLTNHPSAPTSVEYCPINSWSDTTINCTIKKGQHLGGQGWLFVVNSGGAVVKIMPVTVA